MDFLKTFFGSRKMRSRSNPGHCPNCGNILAPNANYCCLCGAKLSGYQSQRIIAQFIKWGILALIGISVLLVVKAIILGFEYLQFFDHLLKIVNYFFGDNFNEYFKDIIKQLVDGLLKNKLEGS